MELEKILLIYPSHTIKHENLELTNNTPRFLVIEIFADKEKTKRGLTIRSCEEEIVASIL